MSRGNRRSGRSESEQVVQDADLDHEALALEASVRHAADEDQAEALVDAAPVEVVEQAEAIEAEEDRARRLESSNGSTSSGAGGKKRGRLIDQSQKDGSSPKKSLGAARRLYRGQTSFDFVGRRRVWFALSGLVIVVGMLSLGFRGLNLGIDFKGGSSWETSSSSAHHASQATITSAMEAAGLTSPTVEILTGPKGTNVLVEDDVTGLSSARQQKISNAVEKSLKKLTHTRKDPSYEFVGPSWGGEITQRAIEALIAFFVLVAIYISFRFEPKMAIAAFIALVHDLLVTVGVYALFGFQVTPDTVIAVLTILGYSLYDTVVVFDRVRDNSRNFGTSGRMTYSEMINLSMNQTLARSINTSLVAILPVLSVLLVGADLLGAVTLQDYGLALFVGLVSGAYSSIFIASPMLAILKEHEPRYAAIRHRLESRGERVGLLTPAAAAALAGAGGGVAGSVGRIGGASQRRVASGRPGALRPGGASPTGRRANVGGARQSQGGSGGGQAGRAAPTGSGTASGGIRQGGASAGAKAASGAKRPPPRPRKAGSKGKKRR